MRLSTHRVSASILASALCAAALLACSGGHREPGGTSPPEGTPGTGTPTTTPPAGASLSLKGSDTMVILAQRFADGYMRSHAGTVIEVSGGGSGTGFAALLNGTTDIANASRPINEREVASLAERGTAAVETRVALDALAVYVNNANTVPSLTMEQLSGIYRGEITNWSAVGGSDAPIILYSRENNSGTYAYFKEHVLGGADFAVTAQTLPGTAAVINAVSHDPNGIGYGGIGYAEGVRTVPLAAGGAPIAPTMENAVNGTYPIARFLMMYTVGAPTGTAADFLAWVVTPEGQALVTEAGFFPLPAATAPTAEAPTTGAPTTGAPTTEAPAPAEAAGEAVPSAAEIMGAAPGVGVGAPGEPLRERAGS